MAVSETAWYRMYREEAWIRQGKRCAYCRVPVARAEATGDHVVARANGGAYAERANIKVACQPCNHLKDRLGEQAFVHLIKTAQPGHGLAVMLAWSRRRLALATLRACARIHGLVT